VKLGLVLIVGLLVAAGCGGSDDDDGRTTTAGPPAFTAPEQPEDGHQPESVATQDPESDGAAGEASPEASPTGPETGELSEGDEEAVSAAIDAYVDALNRRDSAAVCSHFAPGAVPLQELPRRRGGCVGSVGASLGSRPPRGGPAWRRTRVAEVTAVSVEGGGARATATVIHRFRDRKQPSTEEDVIYLTRVGDRWLLAKPSATFYRAVGYGDPPLRALTPP
jgi:hypothetical protein